MQGVGHADLGAKNGHWYRHEGAHLNFNALLNLGIFMSVLLQIFSLSYNMDLNNVCKGSTSTETCKRECMHNGIFHSICKFDDLVFPLCTNALILGTKS